MKYPTQERLKEIIQYDRRTGIFSWRTSANNFVKVGAVAGWRDRGYVSISVDGNNYRAHCLAWLYVTGAWPTKEIDHKNTVKSDNRWSNLREATRKMNMQNLRKAKRDNATGFLGVSPWKGKFKAEIGVSGKSKYLGLFKTPELAHEAYVKAKRELHEGCTL